MPNRFVDEPEKTEDDDGLKNENQEQSQQSSGISDSVVNSDGKNKKAADNAKKAADAAKKVADKAKTAVKEGAKKGNKAAKFIMSHLPAFMYAALIILIILVLVGLFSALTALPNLILGKLKAFVKGFLNSVNYLFTGENIIDGDDVIDLANKIQSMGYDIQSYGFGIVEEYVDEDTKTDDKDAVHGNKTGEKGQSKQIKKLYDDGFYNNGTQYLKAYLAAELSTYGKEKFTFSGSKHAQGLLDIDDSKHFKVEDGRLVTYEYTFLGWIDWGHAFSFDLSNWTAIYGRPLELFLSLHIATMMPELTYEIATNDCFNTKVHIGDQKLTIDWNNAYTDDEERYAGWIDVIKAMNGEIVIQQTPLKTVSIYKQDRDYIENAFSKLDEDEQYLNIVQLSYNFYSYNRPYSTKINNEDFNMDEKLYDLEGQSDEIVRSNIRQIINALKRGEKESVDVLRRKNDDDEFKSETANVFKFSVEIPYNDRTIVYNMGFDNERYNREIHLISDERWNVVSEVIYDLDPAVNSNLYAFSNSLYVLSVKNGEKEFSYGMSLKAYMNLVLWNRDALVSEIIFRYPYIRTVSNHWYYNDIDFMGGERQTTPYGAYELIDAKDLPRYFKFLIQEALPGGSGSGELQIFNDDDDQKILIQVCEPYLNEDEPNKYIKSLFTGQPYSGDTIGFRGKYYKYDGTMETAKKIEIAKILDFYLRY